MADQGSHHPGGNRDSALALGRGILDCVQPWRAMESALIAVAFLKVSALSSTMARRERRITAYLACGKSDRTGGGEQVIQHHCWPSTH